MRAAHAMQVVTDLVGCLQAAILTVIVELRRRPNPPAGNSEAIGDLQHHLLRGVIIISPVIVVDGFNRPGSDAA